MEYWQKITVGTLGGFVATILFYYIMGKLLDYFYIRRKKRRNSASVARCQYYKSFCFDAIAWEKENSVSIIFGNKLRDYPNSAHCSSHSFGRLL